MMSNNNNTCITVSYIKKSHVSMLYNILGRYLPIYLLSTAVFKKIYMFN